MQPQSDAHEQDASMTAPSAPRVLPGSYQYRGGTLGCRRSALWQRSLHMDGRRMFDQSSWFVRTLAADSQGVHSLASITSDAYVPCFALHYHPSPLSNTITASSSPGNGSLLVAGDENGWMHFLHTNCPNYEQQWTTRTKFRAHENAIFDFQWCDPAMQQHSGEVTRDRTGPIADLLITASGDQTLKVWDINQQECLYTLKGHKGSIKTVRMQPGNQNIFASGARDGSLRVFDVRERSEGSTDLNSVDVSYCFKNAQNAEPWKAKRKKQTPEQAAAAIQEMPHNFQSVTSLVFVSPHILVSAGANNASIKAWDLRFLPTRFKRDAIILPSALPYGVPASATRKGKGDPNLFEPIWQIDEDRDEVARTRRKHAISSLALDHTGTKLIANSTDSSIYLYDLFNPSQPSSLTPQQKFSGHSNTSFYPRSAFSPCGRYIASGSTDYDVYVWDTHAIKHEASPLDANGGVKPLLSLPGHAHDANCVAWNPHALQDTRYGFQLASGGDDSTVRMWNVNRSAIEAEESGEIIDEPTTPTSCGTNVKWAASSPFSTPLRTPNVRRVQRTPRSASARRRLFEDGPTDVPAIDSPTNSISASAASPAASAASLDHSPSASLSMSASSLSHSATGLAGSMRDSLHSTGGLARQLRSNLTVSPSKVQMAHEMRAQAREKQRRNASDEEEEEQKEGAAAAPAAAAAAARSSLRPTALNFGGVSSSAVGGSAIRSLPASGSRLVPVLDQVLPVLTSSPQIDPFASPQASQAASATESPSSAPFARPSPPSTASAAAATSHTPSASFAAPAFAPAAAAAAFSSSCVDSTPCAPSYLSFSAPWPSSSTQPRIVVPVLRRTVILRATAPARTTTSATAASTTPSAPAVSPASATAAKSKSSSKSASSAKSTGKKKGKAAAVIVPPRNIRAFFAPTAAAPVVPVVAAPAASAAASSSSVAMDQTPS